MTEQKSKGKLTLIIGGLVLVALIVVLIVALTSCSGDDTQEPEVEPTAAVDDANAEEKKDDGKKPVSSGGSSGSGSSSAGTGTGGSSAAKPEDSEQDRDKLSYILNYGDNVENGMEAAADKFVGELEDIGKGYETGNTDKMGSTVSDFTNSVGDLLGGVRDTIIP